MSQILVDLIGAHAVHESVVLNDDLLEQLPSITRGPLIYFLESGPGGPIKVGFTAGVLSKRMSELQVGNPAELHALAAMHGTVELEAAFHRDLAAHKLGGEWFDRKAVVHLLARENDSFWRAYIFQSPHLFSVPTVGYPARSWFRPVSP